MLTLENNEKKFLNLGIFLVPTLLLTTPNFSVGVILVLCLYSIKHVTNHQPRLSGFDWVVIFCLGFYFVSNIPNLILDLGNFRYVKGPSRILLCILVYLMLRDKIKSGGNDAKKEIEKLKKSYEELDARSKLILRLMLVFTGLDIFI